MLYPCAYFFMIGEASRAEQEEISVLQLHTLLTQVLHFLLICLYYRPVYYL